MQSASVINNERIWNTAVYVRISEAEKGKSESNSIINQKSYIQKFIDKDDSLNVYKVYCDDGYSGGNFDRPAFKQMISDIQKKIIDCVVVKDLSRFGREHIKTNHYMEIYFPSNNIRFISLGENIDSYTNPRRMESIDIPFTNLINDHYLTQVSISTKSSLQIKRKEGKYVGAITPYGYLKSPEDKHRLIIDEDVKDTVVKIFNDYTQGSTLSEIAKSLNENNIHSPAVYKARKKGTCKDGKWSSAAVKRILGQPLYTGDMVQGRTYSPNHKVKKRMPQPRDKWIVIKNTHEAIISHEIFDKAQEILLRDTRPIRQITKEVKPSVLAGYVYCADCGGKMIRNAAICNNVKVYRLLCSTYKRKGRKSCTSHYIQEDRLIDILLETLNLYAKIAIDKDFINRIEEKRKTDNISSFFGSKLKKAQSELEEIKMIRSCLYKDLKINLITEVEYHDMRIEFERQHNDLIKQLSSLEKSIEREKIKKLPANEILEYLKKHNSFKQLTREMVVKLIDRVVVGNNHEIKIIFNFVDIFKDYANQVAASQQE